MATYTSNYGWTKPSGSDNVDISVLNGNLDDQDSTIHDAFLNMAPPFSESSTYAVDDIVLYTTGLYKCHTAVVTPGSWTGSTNWQVYKLSEGGSGGGGTSNYNDLTNKPSINGVTLSGNKTTSDLGINADNVMMSDGVTSVEDAVDELTSGLTNANSNISRIDSVPLYVTKTNDIQLASEASGTVSFAKSDFVIPNGYTANWGAYIYSVVGAWGIACDSDACFNSGEPYFTDSNALVVNVKSHVSGGNVIFRVAVSVMITPTT